MDESRARLVHGRDQQFQIWMPFLIAIGIGALIFRGFKARAFVICLGMSLAIAGLVQCIKIQRGRRRPKQVQTVRMVQLDKKPGRIS